MQPNHVLRVLAWTGVFLGAVASTANAQCDLTQAVLAASDVIHVGDNPQISSGCLVSNLRIEISERGLVNGNLLSDKIEIEGHTTINGNASYNDLRLEEGSAILGTTSTPISLPVVQLPSVVPFSTGVGAFVVGLNQTIPPGN